MELRNVISNILNYSDHAGYNWVNTLLITPLSLIAFLYGGYRASVAENGLLTMFVSLSALFVVIAFIMWSINRTTIFLMKFRLRRIGEDLESSAFATFVFAQETALAGVTFTNAGRSMIDVLLANTPGHAIYFAPTISYTNQPLTKIPLHNAEVVDVNSVAIPRQTQQEHKQFNDAAATSAGSTGVYLPVGDIQDSLDTSLPIARIHLKIMVDGKAYRFLTHPRNANKQVIRILLEMARNDR